MKIENISTIGDFIENKNEKKAFNRMNSFKRNWNSVENYVPS